MIDDSTEAVLRSIFSPSLSESEPEHLLEANRQPGFDDVLALATLLAADCSEEALQQVFVERPSLLLRGLPSAGNSNLSVLTKPPVGTSFRADFAILTAGQGGCDVELVELERASDQLFTASRTPARRLQGAIGQVHDWHQWITLNRPTFVRDMVDRSMQLPLFPERSANGSFALRAPEDIEASWRSFGGFESASVRYMIIIGRWGNLTSAQRSRLVFLNQQNNTLYTVRTYDQFVRRAYDGPPIFW